jgi:hypothetical protein
MELVVNDRIRNRKLRFFENTEVHFKFDSLGSTFKFDFLFDPDNDDHKELACIGHFHIVTLAHEGELLLTGFMINNAFNDFPEKKLTTVAGYSLPGVLQDCEIPFGEPTSWVSATKGYAKYILNKIWPQTLQFDQSSLKEIAQKILNPFNLEMVVDPAVASAMDESYDETTAKESQSAKAYLCELAAQKNIIITDDPNGRVVFTRPKANQKPIFHFDNNIPGTNMALSFNGSGMHSHIKVFQQSDVIEDIPANENSIENPYVPFVFRPHVVVQSSGEANDTLNSARNILSKELKNLTLIIETDRWIIDGKVIRPGQVVSVTNPKVYLYKKTNFFIEEVTLKGNPSHMIATLKCVLPSVYTGETVKYIYQGINLH